MALNNADRLAMRRCWRVMRLARLHRPACARWLGWTFLCLLAPLGAPALARAAFPGANGDLVLAAPCKTPGAGCHGLEIVRPDGSRRRLLCPRVAFCAAASDPEFSPDGRRVVFLASKNIGDGLAALPTVVYADGSCFSFECDLPRAYVSFFGDLGTNDRPAWTGDGRHVLDVSGGSATLDGDDGLPGPGVPPYRYPPILGAAISTHGVLAFARATSHAQRDLFLLRLGQGRIRRLTKRGGEQPSWSPDGSRLAFASAGNVYLIGADVRHLHLLVRDGGNPAFSPDGRYVAFVRRHGDGPGSVLIVSGRGGRPRTVPGASADELDWQPVVPASPNIRRCAFDPGAQIVARSGGVVVATRTANDTIDGPGEQVWLTCSHGQWKTRILWYTVTNGYGPTDTLDEFRFAGPWVAFIDASIFDHYGDGSIILRALDARTGLTRSAASVNARSGTIDEIAVDPYGDLAWIATDLLPDSTTRLRDRVGLDDARGSHILDRGPPGSLTKLTLIGQTVTWLDQGRPRSALVVPKRGY